jgi:hypothetical protein
MLWGGNRRVKGHRVKAREPDGSLRGVSRRALLSLGITGSALLLVRTPARVRAAVSALRPAAEGLSAQRCAQCGRPDHTMLSRSCPAAPRVSI